MVLFEIENSGEFMNSLFMKEWLDAMELVEGEIVTFCSVKIDGRRNVGWYDSQEMENGEAMGEFVTWREYKQMAYQMIKGKKVPSLFRVVFRLPRRELMGLLERVKGDVLAEDVQGVYLNVKYEKKKLGIVTGVSLRRFSMDKALEREWDDEVRGVLRKFGVVGD